MCDSIADEDLEGKIFAQAPLGGRWDLTAGYQDSANATSPVVALVIGRVLK